MMKHLGYAAGVLFAMLAVVGCGGPKQKPAGQHAAPAVAGAKVDTGLVSRLKAFERAPRPKGNFGFYVYDLTADKPVYGANSRVAQSSASCLKLLTGVAGFHLLGTGYAYPTHLFIRGQVADGCLHGDVTFKGLLDPQLNEPDLRMFTAALKRRGIRRLDGKLVVDLLLHYPVKSEDHWYPWDLSFSRYGMLYKGEGKVRTALRDAFRRAGYQLADSQVVLGRMPRGSRRLFTFRRPVDLVVQRMWKNSSNTQATSLLYTIGYAVSPHDSLPVAGVRYLRRFMRRELGLRDTSLVIHDGCGLCTHNHLSPEALVAVLRYGYAHEPIRRRLHSLLAVSGVDGTLRSELSDHRLRGLVHGKTGTLSHPYGISSLAGICRGADGHELAFAIMDTDMSVLDARVLQRKLCLALTGK